MKREELVAYSLMANGEYDQIQKCIKLAKHIENDMLEKAKQTSAITIFDENYPKAFFELKYPPFVIYYKGNLDLLKKDCIGVIGSRNACDYALKATKILVKNNANKVIVNGLAKGIDACAQENAKDTIGILGCGIDYIYPQCNMYLFKKCGLLISEYPGMSKPIGYHFPFRNRLIAALSDKLYVMQSTASSNITISEALELGKEIRVLPYDIFDENGINNNQLIYEGAMPIMNEELKGEKGC